MNLESNLKLDKPHTLKRYSSNIDKLKQKLQVLLDDFKQSGKNIIGYGAPAKATTLMYHFELGPNILDFIIDARDDLDVQDDKEKMTDQDKEYLADAAKHLVNLGYDIGDYGLDLGLNIGLLNC